MSKIVNFVKNGQFIKRNLLKLYKTIDIRNRLLHLACAGL